MILNYKNILLCLLIILFSCANNKSINKKSKKQNSNVTKISKSDPFYPLQESIMDLQDQIIELKSLSRIFKECPFSDKFFLTAVIIFQAQIVLFRTRKIRWYTIPLSLFDSALICRSFFYDYYFNMGINGFSTSIAKSCYDFYQTTTFS